MALSAGTRLGPYEILEPLGAGGMGEVLKAKDTRLQRTVAVKVLPSELSFDAERRSRFEREAHAASALNHPNITTVFDIGEDDGTHYIVMELVEGKTLRELLDEGPLAIETMLPLATQITEGLSRAHGAGIVHRDLKPENLMVREDGLVKILDFGLAKLVPQGSDVESEAPTETRATREGAVLGTVPYMSPEQAASRPLDYRSDQFSLGSILYEMATGKRAFRKDTTPETLAAIIKEDPEPTRKLNDAVPGELAAIVGRCLAKDPARRYESTEELARALRAVPKAPSPWRARRRILWAGAGALVVVLVAALGSNLRAPWNQLSSRAGPAAIESIVVLPLQNLSGDPEQEYFADGMTEALITDLAQIGALKVIARSSSMRYKGTDLPLAEIASRLNVDAVLEGSVQREADQVRITAQLIDTATDRHLWADTFQRALGGALALQSEVARSIADAIAVEVSPGEATRLAHTREVDPRTYEAYLRGMHHIKKGSPEGFEEGMAYLREAVDIDPADPLAYAGLASGYVTLGHTSGNAEDFRRAKAAARRALELDDSHAEAQVALAEVAMYFDWDWEAAEEAFLKAIELSPSHAGVHAHHTWLHVLRGDWQEAFAEAELAQELDPLAPAFTMWLSGLYWSAGRHGDSEREALKALELNPGWGRGHVALGRAYLGQGRFEEAVEQSRIGAEKNPAWRPWLAKALVAAGQREEARTLLGELLAAPEGEVNPVWLASLQAHYGDLDGALASLERGYEARNGAMPWIGSFNDFGELTFDPRFQNLLDRMNLEFVRPRATAVSALN